VVNRIISPILSIVAILALENCARIDQQKRIGLSQESVRLAGQVQQQVKIKAFFPGGADASTRDLLLPYQNLNKKISVEFIDPEKQQEVANNYAVTIYGEFKEPTKSTMVRYGTVVLETGARKERIEKEGTVNEEDITNALARLIKGETKTIYFIEGHGEKQITNTDRTGYSITVGKLRSNNYAVKTLNLVHESRMPDDTSVAIIAGATSEPSSKEIEILDAYLQNGGSLLLLVDPAPAPSLNKLTKKWSIEVDDDFVVDASGKGRFIKAGPDVPLVMTYGTHRITERVHKVMTFFPFARSVAPAPPTEGITVEPLAITDAQSWGERTLKPPVTFDEKSDIEGPLNVALVAVKKQGASTKSRLVVFGDSDFPANAFAAQQSNMNLFIDTVTWLAEDQDFISIHRQN
jgi:ABC-type uncharacterized transport system involved in gliding motility auxiliary subunit